MRISSRSEEEEQCGTLYKEAKRIRAGHLADCTAAPAIVDLK
jgi:hypothetical protein